MARMSYALNQQHERRYETDPARVRQDVRRDLEPDPGAPGAVEIECRQCGRTFWRWKGVRHKHCRVCAAERMRSNLEQLQRRSGPAYEKLVRKQYAYWRNELARLEAADAEQATG